SLRIQHFGEQIKGNQEFYSSNKRVAMDLNMEVIPRTLTFFVNDIEQPNYVFNIPGAVRYFAQIYYKTDSFKILSFSKLSSPMAKHPEGSFGWEYGTKWMKRASD
ncbi:MAG: hypothetical protein EZS28_046201, partial [Streblomastix strix]